MHPIDTGINTDVTSVDGVENTVLEATWVSQVDVKLAILAVLGDSDAGPEGCDISIKDQGEALGNHVRFIELSEAGVAYVWRSAEMNEPTEPWGQPVPP